MKLLALCVAACLCVPAVADGDSPFLKGPVLAAEVNRNCADGCMVLNPAEAQSMMDNINAKLQEREFAAFVAGVAAGKEQANFVCRNRI